MSETTFWWVLTGIAVAAELLSGTFFLLMLAIGAAGGALAAHAGFTLTAQIAVAAVVGGGFVAGWAWWRFRHRHGAAEYAPQRPVSANPDVLLDVGQVVQVAQWDADGSARVHYRGADWTAVPAGDAERRPGPWRIAAAEGNRLIVEPL